MNHEKFRDVVMKLYALVSELEEMFPGRSFTPDGHMVGSLGECLVADAYNLDLMPASNKGFDAISPSGQKIEIKATQSTRVAFRSCPDFTIIVRIKKDGSFSEVYNGPGQLIWKQFEGKKMPLNGQHQISLSRLEKLAILVEACEKVPKTH